MRPSALLCAELPPSLSYLSAALPTKLLPVENTLRRHGRCFAHRPRGRRQMDRRSQPSRGWLSSAWPSTRSTARGSMWARTIRVCGGVRTEAARGDLRGAASRGLMSRRSLSVGNRPDAWTPCMWGRNPARSSVRQTAAKPGKNSKGLTKLPSASTWSFPPRPETHHVRWIGIDPHDAHHLYVAIEADVLVRSLDDGLFSRSDSSSERGSGASRPRSAGVDGSPTRTG